MPLSEHDAHRTLLLHANDREELDGENIILGFMNLEWSRHAKAGSSTLSVVLWRERHV